MRALPRRVCTLRVPLCKTCAHERQKLSFFFSPLQQQQPLPQQRESEPVKVFNVLFSARLSLTPLGNRGLWLFGAYKKDSFKTRPQITSGAGLKEIKEG